MCARHIGLSYYAAILACVGTLAGCLGSGDDNSGHLVPAVDASDAAHAADSPTTDGGRMDGQPDAPPQDAGGDATMHDSGDATMPSGPAAASFSYSPIDFGDVPCGSSAPGQTLAIENNGGQPLAVSAATSGAGFSVTPTTLNLAHGATGMLTIGAAVPQLATAGTVLTGSLNLFTNDPANANLAIRLSATATGAALALEGSSSIIFPSTIAFPTTSIHALADPINFTIRNAGNAPTTFSLGAPSDPQFTLSPMPDGGVTLNGGDTWTESAGFAPTSATSAGAQSSVTSTGTLCGTSLSAVSFRGDGTTSQVTGWPSTVDFGAVNCGGGPPSQQHFTLTNAGTVDVYLTVTSPGNGFATTVVTGSKVPANGGTLLIRLAAPAVPTSATVDLTQPIKTTFTVQSDQESSPHTIALQEEPTGAILNFDTNQTTCTGASANFGNFPTPVVLLGTPQTQNFCVSNGGNAPADVTLTVTSNGSDAGPPAFAVTPASFTVTQTPEQTDSVVFAPTMNGPNTAQISMSVDSATALCSPLPQPLALAGTGVGAGPSITPSSLSFGAPCDGTAPATQTITVSNAGTLDMNWSMTSVTGSGAARYTVTPNPMPGLLHPGQSAAVTVSAQPIGPLVPNDGGAPAPVPSPADLAGALTITTDVPYDPPHAISLAEIPYGDQLSVSVGHLAFGQFPVGQTTQGQTFTISNNANAGSSPAAISLIASDLAYTASPQPLTLDPGAVSTETVTFAPASAKPYPATLSISTTDVLCTALPSPIQLSGTGTQGLPSVSATKLDFGLVNCGATAQPQTFAVSNTGNQPMNVTSVALATGTYFTISDASGNALSLPIALAIGGSATIQVTPKPIPSSADPNDVNAFSDTLTLTTDVAGDSPHTIALAMQAYGTIITGSPPLSTSWTFGVTGFGSIGTFTNTLVNNGNAPATVALTGVSQPTIFGLANNPTTVTPNGVTSIVGQFTPPASDGSWSDQGTLVLTASQAFCATPPAPWQASSATQWQSPTIALAGSSDSNPTVTWSGSLTFPTTDCGSAAPGAQSVTLTNHTNQAYPFTASLQVGAYYSISLGTDGGVSTGDAGTGTLPANNASVITVTPKTVTPGPGIVTGTALYADALLVTVSTSPAITFTIPISWGLNGAVLSLPDGNGPYKADSTTGFTLAMDNAGTAAAQVSFSIAPAGAFTFSPTPPISVLPGVRALPSLASASADASCPSTTSAKATFLYSGPVCQPFSVASVTVKACVGTQP